MSFAIENDYLKRKRLGEDNYGQPGMNVAGQIGGTQGVGAPPEGQGMRTAAEFEKQYGPSVFGIDETTYNSNQARLTTVKSSAASAAAPLNMNDNTSTSQTFSLADSIQMDNLPPTTATSVQTPELASGLTATGNTERNDQQGSATEDNNKGSVGYDASSNFLQGTIGSEYNPNNIGNIPGLESFASTSGTENVVTAGEPEATGEATLTTTDTVEGNAEGVEGEGSDTEGINNNDNKVGNSENPDNENDSANSEDPSNGTDTAKADSDAQIEKQAEEEAAKKAQEETERKAAEKREEEQKQAA